MGTFSVMQSVKVDYNINRFHPFVWNHAMPEKFLTENNIKLDFSIIDDKNRMFIRNLTKLNYTQTRSNSTKTSLCEDVKMDRDEIFRLFGV
jgi:predicted acetyltransferase